MVYFRKLQYLHPAKWYILRVYGIFYVFTYSKVFYYWQCVMKGYLLFFN